MKRRLAISLLILGMVQGLQAQTATVAPTSTPELSVMVTVIPPGGAPSDAQDAVVVYEISDGDILNGLLLFAVVVLLLLNFIWSIRRGNGKGQFVPVVVALLLVPGLIGHAQTKAGQWCGYALIENVPNIESQLPLLSRLTVDALADSNPADLFQTRISLDGSKAIIEGCWLVYPTRDLIVNWISLSVGEQGKESVDQQMTYSLFAPDGTREDSAASVREYVSKHAKDWEVEFDG